MINKSKESHAMFRICTLVRDQLRKELDNGESYEVVGNRLKAFYQVTSPKILEALEKATPVDQMCHLGNVLQCSILIVLDRDESIDFTALRKFLTETWPDMNVEEAIHPKAPYFFTRDGKEVCADPNFRVLLEKVGPDYSEVSGKSPFTAPREPVEGEVPIDRSQITLATANVLLQKINHGKTDD